MKAVFVGLVSAILVFSILTILRGPDCAGLSDTFYTRLNSSAFCREDRDCEVLKAYEFGCGLGCWYPVNRENLAELKGLLSELSACVPENCSEICPVPPRLECRDGRCVPAERNK